MNSLATPAPEFVEIFDAGNNRLVITRDDANSRFQLSVPDERLMIFTNDHAPAVALAILKAAGFAPSGNPEPSGFRGCVETAAGHLDDAVLIAAGEAARAELTRRRDELAHEHGLGAGTYESTSGPARSIINAFIQLQDEATK